MTKALAKPTEKRSRKGVGGRPSLLTPELRGRIIALVQIGNYLDVAGEAVGLDRSTMRAWMTRGQRETSGPYREFADAVARARAEAEAFHVGTLARAAKGGDWRAALEWLKRTRGERWYAGPDTAVQVNVNGEAAQGLVSEIHRHLRDVCRERAAAVRGQLNGSCTPEVEALLAAVEAIPAEVTRRIAAGMAGGGAGDGGGPVVDVSEG